MRLGLFLLILASGVGCISWSTQAQTDTELGWNFQLAAGYGRLDNPLKEAHDLNTVLLPSIRYYGENLYVENFTIGYSLLETRDLLIDIEGRLNEDGLLFSLNGLNRLLATDLFSFTPTKIPIRGPLRYEDIKRRASYLTGLSVTFPSQYGDWVFGHYRDVSGVHHGSETQLRYQLHYDWASWVFGLELGMIYKDRPLVDYYYRLSKEELGAYRMPQTVGGSHNYHARLVANLPLNDQWSYVMSVEHTWLGAGIGQSFLIEDRDYGVYFVGIAYAF